MAERKNLGVRSGDTVRVWQNIVELKSQKGANKKEVTTKNVRRQAFEGLVLAVKHGTEAGATFTVRKVSAGVGVERIFPLYSPEIDRVEVKATARRHRRAKIYYVRERAAREVRKKMKHIFREAKVQSTTSDVTKAPPKDKESVSETAT